MGMKLEEFNGLSIGDREKILDTFDKKADHFRWRKLSEEKPANLEFVQCYGSELVNAIDETGNREWKGGQSILQWYAPRQQFYDANGGIPASKVEKWQKLTRNP